MRLRPLRLALFALLFATVQPARLHGQSVLTRPELAWRTVETPHFIVHYPASTADWALAMAGRIESVATRVEALVGHTPAGRTTIVVEDPLNVSNGFALPFLGAPLIMMFPTPPSPHLAIGEHRGWGEMLSVHEFAHVAHLTRPSRNPMQRFLMRLSPVGVGPLAIEAPRWVTEGYATYIEGQLTGSGRPHGAWRAAVLREWALEGKLPTYQQLDASHGFLAGSMAYLVGSAYLQWLVDRAGPESLDDLWRRMSARQKRTFRDAFAGVFAGEPDDLYGDFTVALTAGALRVRQEIRSEGAAEGELVQALQGQTGGPALSPNDSLLAVVLSPLEKPTRVVVWRTAADSGAAARRDSARARLLRLDPEDVPAVAWRPPPKQPVAVLEPVAGHGHFAPRFMPDGRHVLVTRFAALGDGAVRSDLFEWDIRSGAVRRITHGAAIRSADPAPDGSWAAADRCVNGTCDLVRVDLHAGRVTNLVRGSPFVNFYAPRVAADGRTIAVAVQRDGRWRVALVDAVSGAVRLVDPDDGANRYDATFTGRGDSLLLVSELGGIPNLELLDPHTRSTRPLSRVVSAAFSPEPDSASGDVYFLHLHSKGLDVRRLPMDSTVGARGIPLDTGLAPILPPPPAPADTFVVGRLSGPHDYGLGPRHYRLWPGSVWAPSGRRLSLAFTSADPVGRLVWTLQGTYGDAGTWRGLSGGAVFHRWRPTLEASIFTTRERPSRQRDDLGLPPALDAEYRAGMLAVSYERLFSAWRDEYRLGGSYGALDGPAFSSDRRALAFAHAGFGAVAIGSSWRVGAAASLDGAVGRTAGAAWRRGIAAAALSAARDGRGVRASGLYGAVNADGPAYEQFLVGGVAPGLVDPALLSQRVFVPAVPQGVASGSRMGSLSLSLTGGAVVPYLRWVSAGSTLSRWRRVYGLEVSESMGAIPLVALPEVHAQAGIAYSVDEPFRHRTRVYVSLQYRP